MQANDWTEVLTALIFTLPAIMAAYYARDVHKKVQTPSGTAIGKQIEDSRHIVGANYHYVEAISKHVGAKPSPRANGEAEKVEALTEAENRPPDPPAEPPDGEPQA